MPEEIAIPIEMMSRKQFDHMRLVHGLWGGEKAEEHINKKYLNMIDENETNPYMKKCFDCEEDLT
jgi:hypothetical protein